MAKKYAGKAGIEFDGFLALARRVDELGENALRVATENALTASKDYANKEVEAAMAASSFAFASGERSERRNGTNRPASGRALASVQEVAKRAVEWDGTVAKALVGGDLKEAPEIVILTSRGNPHIKPDSRLKNAVKIKGAVAKEVAKIQQAEFQKVIAEAFTNGEN